MDSGTITIIIAILGVVASIAAIGVTIALFILNNIKSDNKALWTELKGVQQQVSEGQKNLSDFREHVALHHPNEQRINEKIEASRQHLDSALSGINRRLVTLEDESRTTLKNVIESNTHLKTISEWMQKVEKKMDKEQSK